MARMTDYCDMCGGQRGAAMQSPSDAQTLASVVDVLEVYRPHLTDPEYFPDWQTILEDIYKAAGLPIAGGVCR